MKFEVINDELKIAACHLADLTMEQVQCCLSQWEDGASIGTLTLFFERKSGYVVLNRDNKDYDTYLALAEKYLSTDGKGRSRLEKNAPDEVQESLEVLKDAWACRKADSEISISLKNYIEDDDRLIIDRIMERYGQMPAAVYIAFRYGVICGKRLERARRKAGETV